MAETLFSLAEQIRRCTACQLWKSRTLAVPGEGSSNAKIVFVGEAPGAEEDRQGLLFVGRSGGFLTKLLQEIGTSRKEVFITSAVKCHPLASRTPKKRELEICKELWLVQQVTFIRPKLIVLLGNVAVRSLLEEKKDLAKVHGTLMKKNGQSYFLTFHPSAAMRFPNIRQMMRNDFEKLKKIIKNVQEKSIKD